MDIFHDEKIPDLMKLRADYIIQEINERKSDLLKEAFENKFEIKIKDKDIHLLKPEIECVREFDERKNVTDTYLFRTIPFIRFFSPEIKYGVNEIKTAIAYKIL